MSETEIKLAECCGNCQNVSTYSKILTDVSYSQDYWYYISLKARNCEIKNNKPVSVTSVCPDFVRLDKPKQIAIPISDLAQKIMEKANRCNSCEQSLGKLPTYFSEEDKIAKRLDR